MRQAAHFFVSRVDWAGRTPPRVVIPGFENVVHGFGNEARSEVYIREHAGLMVRFIRDRYERELAAVPKSSLISWRQVPSMALTGALGVAAIGAIFAKRED